jgi:hypothetical protein
MTDRGLIGWTDACRAEGVDPAEVRLVLERYRAYRAYYLKGGREQPLPIENWFTWYHAETVSEAGAQAPSPSGCSVDDEARSRGAVRKPKTFLKLLAQLAAIELVA